MGVWGTGLYSGDFAMDLRGTIGAILRLPFSDEALLEVIQSAEQIPRMVSANNSGSGLRSRVFQSFFGHGGGFVTSQEH